MNVRKTSHHFPRIEAPALYLGSLTLPAGSKVLLAMVAERCVRGQTFCPSQRRLGEMVRRRRETISRQLAVLRMHGWIRIIRRGKKLTNVYRLSRELWGRLMGRPASPRPNPQQSLDFEARKRDMLRRYDEWRQQNE